MFWSKKPLQEIEELKLSVRALQNELHVCKAQVKQLERLMHEDITIFNTKYIWPTEKGGLLESLDRPLHYEQGIYSRHLSIVETIKLIVDYLGLKAKGSKKEIIVTGRLDKE